MKYIDYLNLSWWLNLISLYPLKVSKADRARQKFAGRYPSFLKEKVEQIPPHFSGVANVVTLLMPVFPLPSPSPPPSLLFLLLPGPSFCDVTCPWQYQLPFPLCPKLAGFWPNPLGWSLPPHPRLRTRVASIPPLRICLRAPRNAQSHSINLNANVGCRFWSPKGPGPGWPEISETAQADTDTERERPMLASWIGWIGCCFFLIAPFIVQIFNRSKSWAMKTGY